MFIKLHTALLIFAVLYIIGFDSYCGLSGDPRCNGPAVTEADADADPGELRDIGPDEEIVAYEADASEEAAAAQDFVDHDPAER